MRNIYLYGHLADEFGDCIRLDVATAAEAVRALGVVLKGFYAKLKDGAYHVVCGKIENGHFLEEDELSTFKLGHGDLHIMPIVAGSKNSGMLKTILGVVLIGAAVFLSGGVLATAIGATGLTWGNVAMVGAAMALAGAAQLLAPAETGGEDDSSFTTSGPGSNNQEGAGIPLVYGEVITNGMVISGGVDIQAMKI